MTICSGCKLGMDVKIYILQKSGATLQANLFKFFYTTTLIDDKLAA
jgi:hypothetical protein